MLADLLNENFDDELEERWSVSGRRRPSGRSPSGSTRPVVHSDEQQRLWLNEALNAHIRLFGSGCIGWLTAFPIRRRRSRRGSRVTNPLSQSMAGCLGYTLQ
jgi:hypothetical protein